MGTPLFASLHDEAAVDECCAAFERSPSLALACAEALLAKYPGTGAGATFIVELPLG